MRRLATAIPIVCLVPCASIAQTIPVAGGGDALSLAVAVAPDGAVLVVAPGSYYPFHAQGRHLTIVAPQRATIRYQSGVGAWFVDVSGASASQPMRLVGLDVVQGSIGAPPGYVYGSVTCRDTIVENCTCQNMIASGFVVVDGTTVDAMSEPALSAAGATLVLTDSSFHGGLLYAPYGPVGARPAILLEGSTLRAERVLAQGRTFGPYPGTAVALVDLGSVPCLATIADSVLIPGPASLYSAPSIGCGSASTLTVSGTQTPGGIACPGFSTGSLATLRWLQRQWTPGGSSTMRCHEAPVTLAIVVASFSLAPNSTPLTSEWIFAGASPDWFVWTAGVTNAIGDFDFGLTLPNVPAALHASVWLHGLTGPGLPFHATTPLGGLVY
jgi:hypothetical protein